MKPLALAIAVAILALPGAATAAHTDAAPLRQVTISASHIQISGPTTYRPGPTTFRVTARGGEQVFHLLHFLHGYTLADLRKAQAQGDTPAVERQIERNVRFLGGADVFPGTPSAFTVRLHPGTYYIGALDAHIRLHPIEVRGTPIPADAAPRPTGAVTAHDFHWQISGKLPAHGTITVRNAGRQGHVLVLSPVKPGTTRAQLGAYLRRTHASEQAPPPPFALNGPTVVTGLLSPRASMEFSYDLPPGTYALLTFERDVNTGKPQALEGMYAIATLR